jgi:hypothetical protein
MSTGRNILLWGQFYKYFFKYTLKKCHNKLGCFEYAHWPLFYVITYVTDKLAQLARGLHYIRMERLARGIVGLFQFAGKVRQST